MKKILIVTYLIAICMYVFAGCGYENEINTSENFDTSHETSGGALEPDTHTSDTHTLGTKVPDIEKEKEMKIKVTDGNYEVIFQLNDSTASRSLYEQLPLTIEVENYGSNEKIFYPPEKLDTSDVTEEGGPTGSLAYFSPWGNVVMYYSPFGSYPGLYNLGIAIEGAGNIENLSGTITVTAE